MSKLTTLKNGIKAVLNVIGAFLIVILTYTMVIGLYLIIYCLPFAIIIYGVYHIFKLVYGI